MNNQFATQFLREDFEEVSVDDLIASLRPLLDKAIEAGQQDVILQAVADALKVDEMTGSGAVGGGSTTGGGTTDGASWDPQGPAGTGTGEQYAAGTRKKKFQEDAPTYAAMPGKTNKQGAKNLSAYTSAGFKKAPGPEEAGKNMKSIDVEMLWKEGEQEVEVRWSDIEDHTKKLGRKLHGFKPDSSEEMYFLDYMQDAFKKELITSPQSLLTTASNYSELGETLNESRAYSQFKKQTSVRSESERMHEAVKMIHKKLEEVSKLLEFTSQMREELSEGNDTLEYKHNTKKVFEKINKKVVEVYSKSKKLG